MKNTMKKKVEVIPYQSRWPQEFANQAAKIKIALGNNVVAIHQFNRALVKA